MVGKSKVVIIIVGFYLKYGEVLVEVCIEIGMYYVDLIGEFEFVEGLEYDYQVEVEVKKVKIINSCGFDSIFYDLGVFYIVYVFNKELGE